MNNNLLLLAAKWLTELGIRNETAQTYLKINREDVRNCGLFDGCNSTTSTAEIFLNELKSAVSNKLYFETGCSVNYHLNSF